MNIILLLKPLLLIGPSCRPLNHIDNGVQIVRWNGAIGDITELSSTGAHNLGRELISGDVVRATIVGNVISMYTNGALMAQTTDSTFAVGQLGISFFTRPGGNSANFGLASYILTSR